MVLIVFFNIKGSLLLDFVSCNGTITAESSADVYQYQEQISWKTESSCCTTMSILMAY